MAQRGNMVAGSSAFQGNWLARNFDDLIIGARRSVNDTGVGGCNVYVSHIPYEVLPLDLFRFLEGVLGSGTVAGCKIFTERKTLKSRGSGIVEFKTKEAAIKAYHLARKGDLLIGNFHLYLKFTDKEIRRRPTHDQIQIADGILHMGCLVSRDTMHVLWSSTNDVKIEMDYNNGRFRILLRASGRCYKLEWRFQDIYQIDACRVQGRTARTLLVKVWIAPQLYEQLECRADFTCSGDYEIYFEDVEPVWSRTTDFSGQNGIGESFAYCVELPGVGKNVFDDLFHKLADFKLASFHPEERVLSLKYGCSYSTQQIVAPILSSPFINTIPFELVFEVNSLVQQGYLSGPSLGQQFFELLRPSSVTPVTHITFVLEKLKRRKETCYEPEKWLKAQIREIHKKKNLPKLNRIKLVDGLTWVHRVLVTPCRAYCWGPEIEVSNRVTRHFVDNIDNFLRVSFVEEDGENIPSFALTVPKRGGVHASLGTEHTEVFNRIRSVLKDGVTLGNKKFEFLAYSSSQLRENSVWMFAANEGITSDSIRRWMGDFSNIRNVAKCAARMGQSFSSSTKSVDVYPYEVQNISDIERYNGNVKYCFSDGIGKISKSFAAEVAKKCGYERLGGRVPSAFQIRYGGYKGVVAIDPHCSYKLSLRPSMSKFPSTQIGLDILNWSHQIPCYLNREVITLLSTLGVHDSVFEKMQGQVMLQLNQMLQSGEVALDVLQMLCGGDSHRLMVEMLLAGYDPSSEPFLKRMLYAFRASQLMNLRKKSRIFVPKGRILMGCLDETATLAYGEIFVNVSPTPGTLHQIFHDGLRPVTVHGVDGMTQTSCVVQGTVIVTKNPCVHPGDVRVLTAIDVPALHHIVDCVVFPQRGPRPHPNECSGSDLDGDLYFVSWDEALIPPQADPPMDYHAPPQQILDHAVTVQEIEEYFVNYMVNNSLGVISNAHIVFADKEPRQARDLKCLELAKLCSLAVDFPKTGVPVVLPVELRPTDYPDFLEKNDKRTYKSERILGKLYRSVKQENEDQITSLFTKEDARKCYDKKLQVPGFKHYLEEALALKNWYDERLVGLMNQYDVQSEAELVTGNILNLSRFYRKRPGEVKERIQKAVSSLKKEARSWFFEENEEHTNDGNGKTSAYEELAKASAWYHVTYHPDYVVDEFAEGDSEHVHLLSFPWVVFDKILEIKRMQ